MGRGSRSGVERLSFPREAPHTGDSGFVVATTEVSTGQIDAHEQGVFGSDLTKGMQGASTGRADLDHDAWRIGPNELQKGRELGHLLYGSLIDPLSCELS